MKKTFTYLFLFVFLIAGFNSCKKEIEYIKPNQAPETAFSIEAINLSGDNRLNSLVHLTWYGSDPDGYVTGYEISFDNINWDYTTTQDSTFKFSINSGSDTADIEVYVRAIDNLNAVDPSPDYIKIPVKNTPPTIALDPDLSIADTTFLVTTTAWSASDLDGIETITNVYLSINGKSWFELNKSKKTFSLVPSDPTTSDTTTAQIYYESEQTPSSQVVEGLVVNGLNTIYIKAVDQAGTESKVDTSTSFYLKGKKNEILVVSGVGGNAKTIYNNTLNNINVTFDELDLIANSGLYRPKLWNITFRLQLSFYNKLFFYSNETSFSNPYTNLSALLLEFAAASLQQYANNGGKYFITTNFDHNQNIDGFVGVLPIESVSAKNYGSARLYAGDSIVVPLDSVIIPADTSISGTDTTIVPADTTITPTNGFPNLSAQSNVIGVGVYNVDDLDTEILYTANVVDRRPTIPWPDTKVIASGRRVNGKLNQVFFGMQVWKLYQDPLKLESFFNQVFNIEFN